MLYLAVEEEGRWIYSKRRSLNELIGLIILASIGSTFFTVFALPNNRTAQIRQ